MNRTPVPQQHEDALAWDVCAKVNGVYPLPDLCYDLRAKCNGVSPSKFRMENGFKAI
jgi:hypothetical protein